MLGSVPCPVKMPPRPSAIQNNKARPGRHDERRLDGRRGEDAEGDKSAEDGEDDGDLGAALAGLAVKDHS